MRTLACLQALGGRKQVVIELIVGRAADRSDM